ncbi:sugar phosphate isomerase/epimerase [Lentimicrobium sp.]|jgi:sugar phosphate isomerase/epimerase|uniref:sugar phosphate isomerase/epimerase family protein n=1 Tax=Lentimicrobium sp. TaxID=2034841 RepID=UPI002C2AE869|nr:sugar phosphate isomerase/epimerase [Lentimicrobium sp.]HPR26198.1 sugar phosphate isomerase/epimerase [Lentimicrobium sp.]
MSGRRDFLKSLTLVSGSVALGLSSACKNTLKQKKLLAGIQLWTLRDEMGKDPEGTLKKLAVIGYDMLEAYGFDGRFYGREAKEFSRFCAELGLKLISSHTGITDENATAYAQVAAEAGLEYLILPSLMGRPENSADDFKRVAGEMNRIGAACKQAGIKFGYHNHDFEFRELDGKLPYHILLEETDPSLVSFQPDLYWMLKAGQDPQEYFAAFPGRFTTWHLKDMGNDGDSCIIGNGSVDFKGYLMDRDQAGLEYIFVEQEQYAEGPPLYCAEQSLLYIRKNLL